MVSLHYFQGGRGHGVSGVLEETVTRNVINNIPIVKYTFFSDLGEDPMIEVIGKKYNYLFMCSDLGCNEGDFSTRDEIIKTIQFIETSTDETALTAEELKNAEYYCQAYNKTVQLKNGVYI